MLSLLAHVTRLNFPELCLPSSPEWPRASRRRPLAWRLRRSR